MKKTRVIGGLTCLALAAFMAWPQHARACAGLDLATLDTAPRGYCVTVMAPGMPRAGWRCDSAEQIITFERIDGQVAVQLAAPGLKPVRYAMQPDSDTADEDILDSAVRAYLTRLATCQADTNCTTPDTQLPILDALGDRAPDDLGLVTSVPFNQMTDGQTDASTGNDGGGLSSLFADAGLGGTADMRLLIYEGGGTIWGALIKQSGVFAPTAAEPLQNLDIVLLGKAAELCQK